MESQDKIDQADFIDWKRNPVTRSYLNALKQEVEDLKETLANGNTVDFENLTKTAVKTIEVVSKIRVLRDILSINERDIDDEEV